MASTAKTNLDFGILCFLGGGSLSLPALSLGQIRCQCFSTLCFGTYSRGSYEYSTRTVGIQICSVRVATRTVRKVSTGTCTVRIQVYSNSLGPLGTQSRVQVR